MNYWKLNFWRRNGICTLKSAKFKIIIYARGCYCQISPYFIVSKQILIIPRNSCNMLPMSSLLKFFSVSHSQKLLGMGMDTQISTKRCHSILYITFMGLRAVSAKCNRNSY